MKPNYDIFQCFPLLLALGIYSVIQVHTSQSSVAALHRFIVNHTAIFIRYAYVDIDIPTHLFFLLYF